MRGSLGLGGKASSVMANASQNKAQGDYLAVGQQSGIYAGDGGFNIKVAGNTDLKGAVIASSQAAIDQNKNSLITSTLAHQNGAKPNVGRITIYEDAVSLTVKQGQLENAEVAVIDQRKVSGYALNLENAVGAHKARVLESALGYNQGNASNLIKNCKKA